MAGRGFGRGRGRGRGYGGFGAAKQESFELFPATEGLGVAAFSNEKIPLIKWTWDLHRYWKTSPYYYVDRRQPNARAQRPDKPDIERYSDRKSQTAKLKPKLSELIMLDADHVPAELAQGERKRKRVPKKIRSKPKSGDDIFGKLEENQGNDDETEKKENEDGEEEDEDLENEEDEGEFSDEGDYEQAEYFDDDEDDFNMADDGDDEPFY